MPRREQIEDHGSVLVSTVDVDGRSFERRAVSTPWLEPGTPLGAALNRHVSDLVQPGDTVVVSEKVAVLLTGRHVPVRSVRPGRLASLLVRHVRPREGSRGLSVPVKMQYVLDHAGVLRVLTAALLSALTRPLGVRGTFYKVAGPLARDLDGARPPYEHLLLPPLPRADAGDLCDELEAVVGCGVAVVEINDFGGSVRATSWSALPAPTLHRVLHDNPLGQRRTGTPFAVVRPLP